MTQYDEATAIVEAALFASGDTVSIEDLMKVSGIGKNKIKEIVEFLSNDYAKKGSGIEIVDLNGRYVMQIKSDFANKVKDLAPKELTSSQLKTLAVIAYHQPIAQSTVVEMRGGSAYEQIKELEERKFIHAKPSGRTKILKTTSVFSDYFGIGSTDTEEIRNTMAKILRAQGEQSDFGQWSRKQNISVTPLYESVLKMCGISEYEVVNPYEPDVEDLEILKDTDILILSKGYENKINEILDIHDSSDENNKTYEFMIIEMSATTFSDLENNIKLIQTELGNDFKLYGKKDRLEENLRDIKELEQLYREKALLITKKAYPVTEMAARILNDLNIAISMDGISVAPDYKESSKGEKITGEILIPTHKNQKGNLIKRVCEKYDAVIDGLKNK